MTTARRIFEMTEDELRALIRDELGRPKVDAEPKPEVRRRPSPEMYERMRLRRRRMGLDE